MFISECRISAKSGRSQDWAVAAICLGILFHLHVVYGGRCNVVGIRNGSRVQADTIRYYLSIIYNFFLELYYKLTLPSSIYLHSGFMTSIDRLLLIYRTLT